MITIIVGATATVIGLLVGAVLGYRVAIATRTYRDARVTTRAARALWWQVPADWGRVGAVAGWLLIAAVVVVAYFLGRR